MALKRCTKLEVPSKRCPIVFQGHLPKVARAEKTLILTQIGRFRSGTQVGKHWCLWNDAKSLKQHGKGVILFPRPSTKFQGHAGQKMPISTRIGCFRTVTPVWIHRWTWNDAQSLKWYREGALLFFEAIRQIGRSHRLKKINDLNPIWVRLLGRSQLSNPSDLPC